MYMNPEEFDRLRKKFGYKTKGKEKTIIDNLLIIPEVAKKGLDCPTTDVFEMNNTHQIDLLEMPDDDGYKYILTVVDLGHPRYIDARGMKEKTAKDTLKTLLDIYKNSKFLKTPKRIEMDEGSEFKAEFEKHFRNLGIQMAYKKSGRSRQQACVETINGVLAKFLFKRMLSNELAIKGKELIADWINELPELVSLINETKTMAIKNPPPLTKLQKQRLKMSHNGELMVGTASSLDIIPIGTDVRVILDKPVNIQGDKEFGKFRATDMRWSQKIHKVIQLSFRPNQPPMYIVSDIPNIGYTKQQLQIVKPNEKAPHKEAITKYIVEKLLDRRIDPRTKKVQYLVKWQGFDSPDDNTWNYISDIPEQFIKEYNKSLRK